MRCLMDVNERQRVVGKSDNISELQQAEEHSKWNINNAGWVVQNVEEL